MPGVRPTFVTFLTCFGTNCINSNCVLSLTHSAHSDTLRTRTHPHTNTPTHTHAHTHTHTHSLSLSLSLFFLLLAVTRAYAHTLVQIFIINCFIVIKSGPALVLDSLLANLAYNSRHISTNRVLCIGDMGLGSDFGSINGIRLRYAHL